MDQHAEVISIAEARDARARDGADGVADAEGAAAGEGAAGAEGAAGGRPRCATVTAAGRPCRNYATDGQLCRVHAVQGTSSGSDRGAAAPGDTRAPRNSGTPRRSGAPSDTATPGEALPTDGADDRSSADSRRATADGRGATAEGAASTDAGGAAVRALGETAQRAYERLAAEASRRGWNPPVDGLAALDGLQDGLHGEALADRLGELAAFLRRRLTGDYEIDEFGFDEDLTTNLLMPLVRPMHRHYWRVASHGVEHIPVTGGGLVVANHAGTLPADAIITRLDIYDRTGRHARELGADLVFRTPFVGEWARKTGVTLASGDDADRLLVQGELVAVWPEGYKGVGKLWRDRYKLQRFGRGGFVATALRAQVPIVPTAIVGSEEIWPMVYDLRLLARALGLPYFPVVAQMFALPVLGPFALLPLPSKWVIEYGEPIDTAPYGPEAADDPMIVFDLADRVRDTIQGMLHRNLMGRRSVFL